VHFLLDPALKRDPAKNARTLKPAPWHIEVSGECVKRGVYDLEDFIAPYKLQERMNRFRCVEAWSMVIPWVGVWLASVLKTFQATSKAKYVVFKTLFDTTQMPWQKPPTLQLIRRNKILQSLHPSLNTLI
jgi:sulfoxide reductase catalytic subunit YedY